MKQTPISNCTKIQPPFFAVLKIHEKFQKLNIDKSQNSYTKTFLYPIASWTHWMNTCTSKWIQREIIEKIMQKWIKMKKSKKTQKRVNHLYSDFYEKYKLESYIHVDHSESIRFSIHAAVLEKKIFKKGYLLKHILPRPGSTPGPIWLKTTNLVNYLYLLLVIFR